MMVINCEIHLDMVRPEKLVAATYHLRRDI